MQGRRRVAGQPIESATRPVSLHDPAARPVVKGRLGEPVEFGYKAQVVDNEDGLVLDYDIKVGNPADAEQLAPAIRRIAQRLGRVPQQTTADRGYGEAAVDRRLEQLGVQTVVIPRKGSPGRARQEVEHSTGFRELVKWRWNRSLVDGRDRTATWCGYGVLAHNLVKVAHLRSRPNRPEQTPAKVSARTLKTPFSRESS